MTERYVLLGLARARADWFATMSRWATSAALPAEFVRCVSAEELRARLRSGRVFSAAVVAGDVPGLDRDLVAEAGQAGCSVLVVDERPNGRDWRGLGAAAVLVPPFSRDELLEVLGSHAQPVGTATVPDELPAPTAPSRRGVLVAVTGPGGTGASTVAIALAQGLSCGQGTRRPGGARRHPRARGARRNHGARRTRGARRGRRGPDDAAATAPAVLLADLCRAADQAMLHDTQAVVPGIQELVEAHRAATPSSATVREQTFEVPERGYRLLLGLRRHRHWVTLRPRAVDATLDSLQRSADVTVADVDADVEGEAETGSVDVEDRNVLARAAIGRASVVLVVGAPSMKGLYALVRTIGELLAFGVPAPRVVPVLVRSPSSPRARSELTRGLAELLEASVGTEARDLASAVHLPERKVDEALRDGVELPSPLPSLTAGAVTAVLERWGERRIDEDVAIPEPVAPGTMRAFTGDGASDDDERPV